MNRISPIILLLITLLFGSIVSAANSVCVVFDTQQSPEYVVIDNDEVNNDLGDQSDCCDHYCSCIKQINSYASSPDQTNVTALLTHKKYDLYLSQLSPPLLRPPII